MSDLKAAKLIRDIPDFPKPGIVFKDISPILLDPDAMQEIIDLLAEDAKTRETDVIVGIESRGFIFGIPVAVKLGLPFAMSRKLGKLPYDRISEEYALEYGTNTIEMHTDALQPGQRAYIVDDLLATGGTAAASAKLVEKLKGEVCGFGFCVELGFLDGRKQLPNYHVLSLIRY